MSIYNMDIKTASPINLTTTGDPYIRRISSPVNPEIHIYGKMISNDPEAIQEYLDTDQDNKQITLKASKVKWQKLLDELIMGYDSSIYDDMNIPKSDPAIYELMELLKKLLDQ